MAEASNSDPGKSAKRVRTKTYSIGLILVGAVILLQLAALASVFFFRRVVNIDTDAPVMPTAVANLPPTVPDEATVPTANSPIPSNTLPGTVNEASAHGKANPILQPDVSNGRLSLKLLGPQDRILALNKEADQFKTDGDLELARAALLEAENLDPNNVPTLQHQAELAEQIKDTHLASIYWQRIFVLGAQIGAPYTLAEQKLRAMTPVAPPPSLESKTFTTGPIEQTVLVDNSYSYEFNLRIPISLKDPAMDVRPSDISIKLFFYDLSDTGEIITTKARRVVAFVNNNPSWTTNKTEILQASYKLTRIPSDIKSYGYLFRMYYQGILQDEQASPRKLLTIFPNSPPPSTMP